MGKSSRDKGLRRERAIVEIHRKCGIRAERVPLSGAVRYRGNGADVDLYVRGTEPLKAEIKARGDGDGFKTLERWLGGNDALILWRDRASPMVVLPLHIWLELARRSMRCLEPDADRCRRERRRQAEEGTQPAADALTAAAA
ncbi:hypothetical protein [Roseicella aquatilis]|uniref:Uncharacterized protein n=1 Tax=Roseicella aquatilis TaxID=2527868 RepID=A0A4R4DRU2_9PROT|nr:hypothetical protein [Roseicella aquatilis]TCZ63915.1 hypothetical protein EXY23_07985 [Roseicella aquatilis]